MGLCKCRVVTNLFCFDHRTNVCEKCLVEEHPWVCLCVCVCVCVCVCECVFVCFAFRGLTLNDLSARRQRGHASADTRVHER